MIPERRQHEVVPLYIAFQSLRVAATRDYPVESATIRLIRLDQRVKTLGQASQDSHAFSQAVHEQPIPRMDHGNLERCTASLSTRN